jgi:hypothetical protein
LHTPEKNEFLLKWKWFHFLWPVYNTLRVKVSATGEFSRGVGFHIMAQSWVFLCFIVTQIFYKDL